jgi:hypothetical protein
MSVTVLSFCIGLPDSEPIVARFRDQAKGCKYIDDVVVIDRVDDPIYSDLTKRHGNFIKNNHRGHGYWLWKPWIIREYLEKLRDNDVLLYVDVGCELSKFADARFKKYINLLKVQPVLAFSTLSKHPEISWTKPILIEYLGTCRKDLLQTQVAATFIYFRVSDESRSLVDEWLTIATKDNYRYIDDSYPGIANDSFIEHRHDQSIFSLLYKKKQFRIMYQRTFFPSIVYFNNSLALYEPIHTLRNKSKNSAISDDLTCKNKTDLIDKLKYHLIFLGYRIYFKLVKPFF